MDLVNIIQKREGRVNHLASRFRHFNIKLLVISSQNFRAVSPIIRQNATNIVIGSPFPNRKELLKVAEERLKLCKLSPFAKNFPIELNPATTLGGSINFSNKPHADSCKKGMFESIIFKQRSDIDYIFCNYYANVEYKIKGCRHISIIIGNDDEVVNPIKTYNWLTKNKPVINIEMIDGMGHRFDLETFTKFTQPILNMDFI